MWLVLFLESLQMVFHFHFQAIIAINCTFIFKFHLHKQSLINVSTYSYKPTTTSLQLFILEAPDNFNPRDVLHEEHLDGLIPCPSPFFQDNEGLR